MILFRPIKLAILFLTAVFLIGCGRQINVTVDSICSTSAYEKKKYVLLPGNEGTSEDDLQFQEFAMYTDKILRAEGFVKATQIKDAEIAILLSYGISDPQFHHYTYSVPVWGQTGVSSSNSNGRVYMSNNSAYYSENTTYTPSYGVIGSSTHLETQVFFERYIVMKGFDLELFKKTDKIQDAREIWSTKINSIGECGDFRLIFPVLLIASEKDISKNTGGTITHQLEQNKRLEQRLRSLRFQ